MLKKIFGLILTAALVFSLFPAATALASDELKNTDPEKYYIVLDLKNQIVTVYEKDKDGEYTKIVRRFLCTSGKTEPKMMPDPANPTGPPIEDPDNPATPTPLGIWKVGGRERFGKFAAFGGEYARYWTQIVGGVYFHSIMFDKRDINYMQSGAFRRIGSKASHGCVRLYVEDAKWLYYYACPGTTVEVTDKLPSNNAARKKLKTKLSFSTYNAFQKKIYDIGELPNPIAWVVKDKAEMRTGNGGETDRIVKRIPEGEQVEVLQVAEPWCKIKHGGREGYMRTAYITFEQGKMNSKADADIVKKTAWMYTAASEKSEQITKVPSYSSIKIIEPDKDGWTKIQYWDETGYIQTKFLTKGWGVIRE